MESPFGKAMRIGSGSERSAGTPRRRAYGAGRAAVSLETLALILILGSFALTATGRGLAALPGHTLGADSGIEPVASNHLDSDSNTVEGANSVDEPSTPRRRPSFGYVAKQWLLRAGFLLMVLLILGFLGVSALFLPPLGAWFIYLFLLPFLAWLPGMVFHPAVGWALCGAWLITFPVTRRWLYNTPSGRRLIRRQRGWLARFEGGDLPSGSWRPTHSPRSSGSSSLGGSGRSSVFSPRGGRFGGGGASGRW
jgi:uncharacterized membrane protein YgcG